MANETPRLPERPTSGHKGTFGRVLIIGGSIGMSGAISLSGSSCLRSGAGLVTLAVPEPVLEIVASYEPSYLCLPLSADEHGGIAKDSLPRLKTEIDKMDAVAIGPGLGRSEGLTEIVEELYQTVGIPMVCDADALNALAETGGFKSPPSAPRILTPHPGEFARLCDMEISEVQRDRKRIATEFAQKYQVVLVLKGPGTVVTDGEFTYINETGNPGMGTGGTGDVLTGIIAGLLAQRMKPLEAARLGVFAHGLAGDIATEELSEFGMIASDLLKTLPEAWKRMQSKSGAG